jgi:hypothetical protein
MMSQVEYIGALHFAEEGLAKDALKAMKDMNIAAKYIHTTEIPDQDLPEWVDRSTPGWVFFIDKAQFSRGMEKLGELMDYKPD